jgi:hypothetical protein
MRPENYGTITQWETLLKAGHYILETSMPGLTILSELALIRFFILPLTAVHISIVRICTLTEEKNS